VRRFRQFSFLSVLLVFLAGCSAPTKSGSSSDAANYQGRGFENILVIGKAEDYDGRARFERTLVSQLKAAGADAKAYYLAVGGNKPIDRATIEELVESDKFDAVLITRVLSRNTDPTVVAGSTATKSSRRDDGALHLFRYDYEELNEPASLNIDVSVLLSSELFDTSNGELIWSAESSVEKKEMVSEIVDEVVSDIIRGLEKKDLIGH